MRLMVMLGLLSFVSVLVGCGGGAPAPAASSGPSAEGAKYVLAAEPGDAKGVKELKADAKDGDDIVIEGRIGGDEKPWVEGQAAFMIVDKSLKPCNEKDDDDCKTPWDYCCDTDQLPSCKALVKIIDSEGKTVASDAKKLLGVKELTTVVLKGKAKKDEAGNLTVLASGVFVRK
ncbi:hypothetical protein [Anatilimnocola floriformis]|uniref:hypothetical protein n=1 Tax=Anatilimnocola floriformis TaxID=2948575 RepID=UPI0020C53AF9|nr:hypothetical protein [Anatilimnocola floriformis]